MYLWICMHGFTQYYTCIDAGHMFVFTQDLYLIYVFTKDKYFVMIYVFTQNVHLICICEYTYMYAFRIESRRMTYIYVHHTHQSIWYSDKYYKSVKTHICIHTGSSHPGWHISIHIYLLCICRCTFECYVSVNIHVCIHLRSGVWYISSYPLDMHLHK